MNKLQNFKQFSKINEWSNDYYYMDKSDVAEIVRFFCNCSINFSHNYRTTLHRSEQYDFKIFDERKLQSITDSILNKENTYSFTISSVLKILDFINDKSNNWFSKMEMDYNDIDVWHELIKDENDDYIKFSLRQTLIDEIQNYFK